MGQMRFGSLLTGCLVALLALASVGCLSGQTGSPDCVGSTSCLCDRLYAGGVLLRVHGESQEPGKLVAVVDALLSPSDQTLDLAIGDRVGGSVLAELPCAPEREMPKLIIGIGLGHFFELLDARAIFRHWVKTPSLR